MGPRTTAIIADACDISHLLAVAGPAIPVGPGATSGDRAQEGELYNLFPRVAKESGISNRWHFVSARDIPPHSDNSAEKRYRDALLFRVSHTFGAASSGRLHGVSSSQTAGVKPKQRELDY